MRREELVELRARAKAQEASQFGPVQVPELEFFECQRFERAAFDLARGAEQPGKLVGDSQGDLHIGHVTPLGANVNQ
jgi:hypothetical protein